MCTGRNKQVAKADEEVQQVPRVLPGKDLYL